MKHLTPDRWAEIDAMFQAALDEPPGKRSAFLDKACADDPTLRLEVEKLLHSDDSAEEVLGDSVTDFAAPLIPGLKESLTQQVEEDRPIEVGPYRILEEIGRGGMGTVYLADRADEKFERHVALKLVKRGMDTDEIVRRFRYERQILASLEHPLIARLYDGGVSDDGRPYLVMENIQGLPIDQYCDKHRLSIAERVALFRTVCEAVEYAHRNLVVHRDLKPSNILVREDGTAKLLDFGIAKLLTDDGSSSRPITRTGMQIMTPEYASPEQLKGEVVSTGSDVYALGVVFYELLTGRRPFASERRSGGGTDPTSLTRDPARPSSVVTKPIEVRPGRGSKASVAPESVADRRSTRPDRLARELRGDLDTIALKALRRDPSRRYPSAQAFLDDLRRHADGLPVEARPDTFGYRGRKFIVRNRVWVAFVSAIVLLALGFASFYVVRVTHERNQVALEAEKTEAVKNFLVELIGTADPYQALGDTVTVRQVLDRGAARIDSLGAQPEVQAELMNTIGGVYLQLGVYDRALPLLERAVDLTRSIYGSDQPEVARSLRSLAGLHFVMRDYESARPLTVEALEILRQANGEESDEEVAEILNDLGVLSSSTGAHEDSERYHLEALALRRRLLGEEHVDVAMSLNNLSVLYWNMDEKEKSERFARETLELRRKLLGNEHPDVAMALNNLASALESEDRVDEAESMYREALAIRRKVLGPSHPRVAVTAYNLAILLQGKQAYDEAESLFRETIEIDRERLGADHAEVGVDIYKLAVLLREKGDAESAEAHFRDALRILTAGLRFGHPRIAIAKVGLGGCLTELGRYREAEELLLDALRTFEEAEIVGGQERALEGLVELYVAWDRPVDAAERRSKLEELSSRQAETAGSP